MVLLFYIVSKFKDPRQLSHNNNANALFGGGNKEFSKLVAQGEAATWHHRTDEYGRGCSRRTSIGHLLGTIESSGKIKVPKELKEAAILIDYAVTTRYPGDWEPVGEAEFKQAVALDQEVFQWVSSLTDKDREQGK
ncbi:MAG: hypothetical protein QMC95_02660 [Desulfitobacteriaceae bacterium]|nr:hypothetical protein [Desulfitobacteriaceae bacterium]MDI6913105.1 hypothetical protein [Desulfitobacteriaceae bacterium]